MEAVYQGVRRAGSCPGAGQDAAAAARGRRRCRAEKRQPPDEELKALKPRDGFEINLFASEADGLVKPIQFAWDERGRLWALCAPSYPQLIPGTAANDYILICEDTDGDGRADKFDRFAEGLFMPTGLALGRRRSLCLPGRRR